MLLNFSVSDSFMKKAQLLAEMDEEFGISNLVEEEFGSFSRKRQPVG